MLEATGLGARFGRLWALRGVSLRLAPGEVLSVRGGNGAGKTTLLRLCAGLLVPAEGRVALDSAAGAAALRAHSVLVGAPPDLYPSLSLEANLRYGLAVRGLRVTRVRAGEVLREFGVARPETRAAGASLGEGVRCAMAIANLAEPELLLLDEPAGCLDEEGLRLLDSLMARTLARGGCVVEAAVALPPRGRLLVLERGAAL